MTETNRKPIFRPLPKHRNPKNIQFLAKFADRVQITKLGCWVWLGNKVNRGYGRVYYNGKHQLTHRLVYHICVGDVTKNLEVCHNCPGGDNTSCCNPSHLFLGTHTDNMRDSETKGRNSHPGVRGEQHGSAKLTEVDVLDIRRRVAAGENGRVIAEEKGISRTTVSEIASRKKWAHVTDIPK